MRALISVSDKRHLTTFAASLHALGVAIYATGKTATQLDDAAIPVHRVSELTHFPEILDGRVKTLHPAIHGGILARRDNPAHLTALDTHAIGLIDLVVVNLYPFEATVARLQGAGTRGRPRDQGPGTRDQESGVPDPWSLTPDQWEVLEQIDIGGPTLVRAAAKNYPHVLVVIDPADYDPILAALRDDTVTPALRQRLAAKAFAHTAAYDAAIAAYLADDPFPDTLPVAYHKAHDLRYGENPHQHAALYGTFADYFEHLHGKDLSYINILDIAAAQELIEEFAPAEGAALAIIKHTNPCGVGLGATLREAWDHAFATDREAPFGGVIVVNAPVDLALATVIDAIFTEIIIAPDFAPDALRLLRGKKNRRLIRARQPVTRAQQPLVQSVPGGVLVQEPDRSPLADEPLTVVTQRAPTDAELRAMRFAWRVVKHVKSNAIVYSTADRTLGIGAGQMSRVDSSRLAVWKAQHAGLALQGSVIASDALFPFPDSVEIAAAAGATAVIQPGSSVRDQEVIAAADRLGVAMVFTGRRHFRH